MTRPVVIEDDVRIGIGAIILGRLDRPRGHYARARDQPRCAERRGVGNPAAPAPTPMMALDFRRRPLMAYLQEDWLAQGFRLALAGQRCYLYRLCVRCAPGNAAT